MRAEQLATGTILVYEDTTVYDKDKSVIIYARVSSHDQKGDMERQVTRLKDYAAVGGMRVRAVVEEIGSG